MDHRVPDLIIIQSTEVSYFLLLVRNSLLILRLGILSISLSMFLWGLLSHPVRLFQPPWCIPASQGGVGMDMGTLDALSLQPVVGGQALMCYL
jgi:hypothetical protein